VFSDDSSPDQGLGNLPLPDKLPLEEDFLLTKDMVREEAYNLLVSLGAFRKKSSPFVNSWRQLWQLVREAKASSLEMPASDGPWYLGTVPHDGGSPTLAAGDFFVPVWPIESPMGKDLLQLLNWAGVPIPHGQTFE
jgi:hypothetical protein